MTDAKARELLIGVANKALNESRNISRSMTETTKWEIELHRRLENAELSTNNAWYAARQVVIQDK